MLEIDCFKLFSNTLLPLNSHLPHTLSIIVPYRMEFSLGFSGFSEAILTESSSWKPFTLCSLETTPVRRDFVAQVKANAIAEAVDE